MKNEVGNFVFHYAVGNAFPVRGHGGPLCCEMLRVLPYLDSLLTDGGKVVSLTLRPPFTPQEDSWYILISIRG
jgi:hypothetical protein